MKGQGAGSAPAIGLRIVVAGAALAILLGVAAFSRVSSAGFVQDDVPIVQLNPVVKEGSVGRIFGTDWWGGVGGKDESLYRPVTLWSFALERGPGGDVEPRGAHVVNVVLHLAVALLLGALALRLGAPAWVASSAALLFAVHPVHTAAVAGLVGRAEVLAGLFGLGAVLLQSAAGTWERAGSRPAAPGPAIERAAAWGAAACVFLAAGSKETGLLVPVLLVVLEGLYRRRGTERTRDWLVARAAALAPTILALLLHLVLRVRALGAFPGLQRANSYENALVGLDGIERIATALGLLARYFGLLVWPARLSADYSGNAIAAESTLLAPRPLAGLVLLVALASLAVLPWAAPSGGGDRRVAAFAAWLFLAPYLVVSNLGFTVGQIFAERFVYVPSLGFCLLVPVGAAFLAESAGFRGLAIAPLLPRLGAAALVVVSLAGVVRTRAAVAEWQTDETLYAAARRNVPEAPRASFVLAKIRLRQGRTEEALALIDETLRLWPKQSGARVDRGTVFAERGDLVAAEADFRAALRINPYNQRAAVSLGVALARLGRLGEAERVLRGAVRRDPRDPDARRELDALLAQVRGS